MINNLNTLNPPVITIDGPSGSGKSSLCKMISKKLGWPMLESGLIYRIFALMVLNKNIILLDEKIYILSKYLNDIFSKNYDYLDILLNKVKLFNKKEIEEIGEYTSKLAPLPFVRKFLIKKQILLRKSPGLVTNGRDTGTVVFPDALIKFYLSADLKTRVSRRLIDFKKKDINISFKDLLLDMDNRDNRDKNRKVSPLIPAKDSIFIDSTNLTRQEVFENSMKYIKKKISF